MSLRAGRLLPAFFDFLRSGVRLLAMAGLLVAALALYHLWKLAGLRNPWPPRFLSGIGRIAGVRVRISGRPAPGQLLILANHVSWIDIPALAGATGTAFVAHEGLAAMRVFKWLCEMNGTIFIARNDRASIASQIETLRTALAARRSITIFPEGTTSDGTALLPFKSALLGALDPLPPGITVQPVWLDYGPQSATIAWIDAEPGIANFKRIIARARPLDMTVHFLPPLTADALKNRKTVANAAHQAIEQAATEANRSATTTPLQKSGTLP